MKVRVFVVFLLMVSAIHLVVGCKPAQNNATGANVSGRKIKAVATTGMIRDVIQNVGGERVEAIGLMGPGVDPHLYRTTAGDVQALENADIIFYNGLELEGRMTDIFVKMARSGKATIAVCEKVPQDKLREPPEFQGKYDPHIWFDLTLWKYTVETVREELSRLDSSNQALYQANATDYLKKLDELHKYVQAEISKVPESQRVLVTAHDAFGYFGKQYGVEVMGLQGTSTATEAGAGDVRRLSETIAKRKIKAMFVESSVPKETIVAVQKAVQDKGWNVQIGGQLFSDAMGQDGTPEGTYLGMVRHNVDTIVKALK